VVAKGIYRMEPRHARQAAVRRPLSAAPPRAPRLLRPATRRNARTAGQAGARVRRLRLLLSLLLVRGPATIGTPPRRSARIRPPRAPRPRPELRRHRLRLPPAGRPHAAPPGPFVPPLPHRHPVVGHHRPPPPQSNDLPRRKPRALRTLAPRARPTSAPNRPGAPLRVRQCVERMGRKRALGARPAIRDGVFGGDFAGVGAMSDWRLLPYLVLVLTRDA